MGQADSDILGRIIREKEREVALREAAQDLSAVAARARAAPAARGFARRLSECADREGAGFICEIKRASPSRGMIREDFDVHAIAEGYERNGAACLSVLTDPFFMGTLAHLACARNATRLPLLCKDFVISAYQVHEARACGADAILLLASVLDLPRLREFGALAGDLGMDCLVEVHDEEELAKALDTDIGMVGINNRNLRTFEVSLEVTAELLPLVPGDRLVVSESGISSPRDVARLRGFGARGLLVGEVFMSSPDPGRRLSELRAGLAPGYLSAVAGG